MKEYKWTKVEDALPEELETILLIVSGNPCGDIEITNCVMTGVYVGEDGWVIDSFPYWTDAVVTWWCDIPELPDGI